jgi:hypothetical protein
MAIEKYLDISTGHITYEDSQTLLWKHESFPTRVIAHEYGWWICVYDKKTQKESVYPGMRKQGYSEAFIDMMRMAADANCSWINLDSDGDYLEGLETFDW